MTFKKSLEAKLGLNVNKIEKIGYKMPTINQSIMNLIKEMMKILGINYLSDPWP